MKKAFPNFLSKSFQRKKLSNQTSRCGRTRYYFAMPILLCFPDVFLYFWNVFISHVWEVNNCSAWVKSVVWNRSETVWNFIKTLWRKTVEIQETHDVVSTSTKCLLRRRLTLVNAHSYDDILGVCWGVPKILSHTLTVLFYTDSVYFILTYLLSMIATVTLLIVGFYWNKSQVFQYHRKSTFKNCVITFLQKLMHVKASTCNSNNFLNL